jgi:hypothetical protein
VGGNEFRSLQDLVADNTSGWGVVGDVAFRDFKSVGAHVGEHLGIDFGANVLPYRPEAPPGHILDPRVLLDLANGDFFSGLFCSICDSKSISELDKNEGYRGSVVVA